jgi:hypothetical protein
MEAPPFILSEICLDPEFASTAAAESHASPSSFSFSFRASSLPSGLLGSPLVRLPLELGQSHILQATCDTSNPVFANYEQRDLCYVRLLTGLLFE